MSDQVPAAWTKRSQEKIDALVRTMRVTTELVAELECDRARVKLKAMPAAMRESYRRHIQRTIDRQSSIDRLRGKKPL